METFSNIWQSEVKLINYWTVVCNPIIIYYNNDFLLFYKGTIWVEMLVLEIIILYFITKLIMFN